MHYDTCSSSAEVWECQDFVMFVSVLPTVSNRQNSWCWKITFEMTDYCALYDKIIASTDEKEHATHLTVLLKSILRDINLLDASSDAPSDMSHSTVCSTTRAEQIVGVVDKLLLDSTRLSDSTRKVLMSARNFVTRRSRASKVPKASSSSKALSSRRDRKRAILSAIPESRKLILCEPDNSCGYHAIAESISTVHKVHGVQWIDRNKKRGQRGLPLRSWLLDRLRNQSDDRCKRIAQQTVKIEGKEWEELLNRIEDTSQWIHSDILTIAAKLLHRNIYVIDNDKITLTLYPSAGTDYCFPLDIPAKVDKVDKIGGVKIKDEDIVLLLVDDGTHFNALCNE